MLKQNITTVTVRYRDWKNGSLWDFGLKFSRLQNLLALLSRLLLLCKACKSHHADNWKTGHLKEGRTSVPSPMSSTNHLVLHLGSTDLLFRHLWFGALHLGGCKHTSVWFPRIFLSRYLSEKGAAWKHPEPLAMQQPVQQAWQPSPACSGVGSALILGSDLQSSLIACIYLCHISPLLPFEATVQPWIVPPFRKKASSPFHSSTADPPQASRARKHPWRTAFWEKPRHAGSRFMD